MPVNNGLAGLGDYLSSWGLDTKRKRYRRSCLWCEKSLVTYDKTCWFHSNCRQARDRRVMLDDLGKRGKMKRTISYE